MNHLKNILEAASIISFDSDLMLKKHDEYVNYITPLFCKKFPEWEYRYEYENLYSLDVKNWLKKERKKFDKKFTYLIYLINNEDEILNSNLEWDDCILDLQDQYALFDNIDGIKDYKYQRIGIITFLK